VATVFAAIVGSASGEGGFAVPDAVVRHELALAAKDQSVSTGPCAG
jgi:hypothetical protein